MTITRYTHELTKEQVEKLPEYHENVTIDPAYEEQVRSVLRPMVTNAMTNDEYSPNTYDLSQEPYFYVVNDQTLKSTQEQLVTTKKQRK